MSEERCPKCGGVPQALYTAPPIYVCCGRRWDGEGIKVLSAEESRRKRPELYDDIDTGPVPIYMGTFDK